MFAAPATPTRRFCLRPGRLLASAVLIVALLPGGALAQQPAGDKPESSADQMPDIKWQHGPAAAKLGDLATIQVPRGYRFADAEGTAKLMELMENPVQGNELGLIAPEKGDDAGWFVVFEFDDVGFVKDDERDKLDADGMLDSIRKGTAESNKERAKRGWGQMEIVGWERAPKYDPQNNNLVWAIRGRSNEGDVVNYNTRRLGRKGVMSVALVLDPGQLDQTIPAFDKLMTGFSFQTGSRYGDFRAGDKIAKYGLTALVTGGAAAVAVKTGIFKWLWKVIVVGVAALGAFLKRVLGGRKATA